MQLRSLLKASSPTAAAAVLAHHLDLLRALQLGDAAVAVITHDTHCEQVQTVPQGIVRKVIGQMSTVKDVYSLALSALCTGGRSSIGKPYRSRNEQQAAADTEVQQSSDQQEGQLQQQQRQHDLLRQLPLLFAVLRKLQLLAQQLQLAAKHVGNPMRPKDSAYEDCQQHALGPMAGICGDLVDVVRSRRQQQQVLRLRVLDSCCAQFEAALRSYGLIGEADTTESVGKPYQLLLWLVSRSAASQQSGSVSSSITVQDVGGLLITIFKCQAAWLHRISSEDSSRTFDELTDDRLTQTKGGCFVQQVQV